MSNFVIPDPDPVSPAYINGWRSRIKCEMTAFLDSLKDKTYDKQPRGCEFDQRIECHREVIEEGKIHLHDLSLAH